LPYGLSSLEVPLPRREGAGWTDAARAAWSRVRVDKMVLFVASLYLFVLSITLMKEGARGVAPLVRNLLDVTTTASALGFGWLFAYLIMSGSPIAAAALTFFDAGVVDELGAFSMITGSRLGASFIVLFIGFLYRLRGRNKSTSLGMGLLSLTVTASSHLPGLFLGAVLLKTDLLDSMQLQSGTAAPVSCGPRGGSRWRAWRWALLPTWAGLCRGPWAVVWLSFNYCSTSACRRWLSRRSQLGWMSRLVYRPWVMFALGAVITMISMSVSLSLAILVPLSARGFVRRENVIPYIMGANITTFVDTLLAAVLLENPPAFTIVLVKMVSITVVSIVILATVYRRYERWMLDSVAWITARNRNLALFMVAIFVVPIALLLF